MVRYAGDPGGNFASTFDLILKTTSDHCLLFPNIGVDLDTMKVQTVVNATPTLPTGNLGIAIGCAASALGPLTAESPRLVLGCRRIRLSVVPRSHGEDVASISGLPTGRTTNPLDARGRPGGAAP